MSPSFIASPDSLEVFACFLKTIVRHLYVIYTSVAKFWHSKFAKISGQQVRDIRMNILRLSHDSRATYFSKKNCVEFLNMFKTFATNSQHMKILMILA